MGFPMNAVSRLVFCAFGLCVNVNLLASSTNPQIIATELTRVEQILTQTDSGIDLEGIGNTNIVFQKVNDTGFRALIHIANANDPELYEFRVHGAKKLELQSDGSVLALDEEDSLIAWIMPPWAKDANGRNIQTFFQTDGNTLVQVVKHQGGEFKYGIIADPFWVPAGIALRFCMKNKTCRKIAAHSTKEAIRWAIENLF